MARIAYQLSNGYWRNNPQTSGGEITGYLIQSTDTATYPTLSVPNELRASTAQGSTCTIWSIRVNIDEGVRGALRIEGNSRLSSDYRNNGHFVIRIGSRFAVFEPVGQSRRRGSGYNDQFQEATDDSGNRFPGAESPASLMAYIHSLAAEDRNFELIFEDEAYGGIDAHAVVGAPVVSIVPQELIEGPDVNIVVGAPVASIAVSSIAAVTNINLNVEVNVPTVDVDVSEQIEYTNIPVSVEVPAPIPSIEASQRTAYENIPIIATVGAPTVSIGVTASGSAPPQPVMGDEQRIPIVSAHLRYNAFSTVIQSEIRPNARLNTDVTRTNIDGQGRLFRIRYTRIGSTFTLLLDVSRATLEADGHLRLTLTDPTDGDTVSAIFTYGSQTLSGSVYSYEIVDGRDDLIAAMLWFGAVAGRSNRATGEIIVSNVPYVAPSQLGIDAQVAAPTVSIIPSEYPTLESGFNVDVQAPVVSIDVKQGAEYTRITPPGLTVPAPTVFIQPSESTAPSFLSGVNDQIWRQRQTTVSLQLPAASGGSGQLGYKLIGDLPSGVVFNPITRVVSGTPTVLFAKTAFTWRVTDANNLSSELTFFITVLEADVQPTLATVPETTFYTGEDNTYVLPVAAGGNGVITYALFQVSGQRRIELPETSTDTAQPVFNKATRTLSMNPEVVASSINLVYVATDADGDKAEQTFIFMVTFRGDDRFPEFATGASIAAQAWRSGQAITRLALPKATGGNAPLRYSFSPPLPAGITFDESKHELSGTPTEFIASRTQTFTVEDANDDADSLQFTLRVDEPDISPKWPDGASIADQLWTSNVPIPALTLPAATLGNGELVYTLTPGLPGGVAFDPATRRVSGTAALPFTRTEFTYTATDRDGDSISLKFFITVPDTTPQFGSQTIPNLFLVSHRSFRRVLPAATGGNEPHSYRLVGELPTGVTFTPATRVLEGTPTSYMLNRQFRYITTDADGDTATLTFTITVPDILPTFGALTIADQRWQTGVAIRSLLLPRASGGNGAIRYALTPGLPGGIIFNPVSRTITGTPNTVLSTTEFTWRATDADGQTAEIKFTITIPDSVPELPVGASIASLRLKAGEALTPVTLPRATGGNIPVRYVITPGLPSGITFDPASLVLSGAPRFQFDRTEFEYYAEDANGSQSRRLKFTIQVSESPLFFPVRTLPLQRWVQGDDERLQLPEAGGGDGTGITYSLTFDPQVFGIEFDPDSRRLSGMPQRPGAYTGTFIATNSSGAQAILSFRVIVSSKPQPTYESFVSVTNTDRRTLIKAQEVVTTDKTTNPEVVEETTIDPPPMPPVDPTGQAMVSGFRVVGQFRQIRLEWTEITLPQGVTFPPWQVQVSETGVTSDPWYSLRNDGVDWKGNVNTASVISTGFYDHYIGRDNLELWYRVRFVGSTDWSASFNATTGADTRPVPAVVGFQASGRGWTIQLDWDLPDDTTPPVKHWEIQVASAAGGPWYSLVNGGDGALGWRGVQNEWTEQTANYYTHFALPIRSATGPVSLALFYRIRAVSLAGIKSDWTDGASTAMAMGITKGDLGANIIDAALIDPENFLKGFDGADLSAWWSMDESGGGDVITDIADNGNDLDINASRRPVSRDGASFRALEFTTPAYSVSRSSLSVRTTAEISVSCWVDLDVYAGSVFSWRGVGLGFRSSSRVYFRVGSAEIEATVTGLAGTWHHIVGTWAGGSDIKLYVDGIEQTGANGQTGAISGSSTVTVGAFDGALDEMRVYSRELELAEVRFLTLVPGGPSPGMVIADKIIAKSITAREIRVDALEGLIAELRQLVLTGRAGQEIRGRTIATGDIETFIDNDQLIQYRALRDSPSSISHWEVLTQLRSFGRESELEMWDRSTGRNMVFNKNGIAISGGTTTQKIQITTSGMFRIDVSTSPPRYLEMRSDRLRLQHDGDTYISLDHSNGLRVYDGDRKTDLDADELKIAKTASDFASMSSGKIRIQLSATRYVEITPASVTLRNGSAAVRLATLDDIPDTSDFATDAELAAVRRLIPSSADFATRSALANAIARIPDSSNDILTLIGPRGISTGYIGARAVAAINMAAGSIDLGSATVKGTLTADHIVSDVFNVKLLTSSGRTLTDAGGSFSSWYTVVTFDNSAPYDFFLAVFSVSGGYKGTIALTADSTSYFMSVDTAKGIEIQARLNTASGSRRTFAVRFRDHVEAFAGTIGTVSIRQVWGVRD